MNNVAQGNDGDNNIPVPAAGGDNNGQPQPSAAESNSENTVDSENVVNDNNESMISTVRTFITSFFTSLLPETPAAL